MKFGVFLPNGSNGYIMSKAIPPYMPTWELNRDITLEAERLGFDFVLSMMKFRGFGGETGYWDGCLESFSLTSALATATQRIGLIPTASLLALHPAYVARTMATLDDISGGRVALNIVTGWNKPEYAQMGLWRGDAYYAQRYAYALDYVHVLRTLWRDGTMTHHSAYFNLDDCQCLPTPTHEIPLVSAGQSGAGQDFVSQIGGHSFAMVAPERLHTIAAGLKQAGAQYGTRVGTYGLFQIVAAETEDLAWQTASDIVAGGDIEAIKSLVYSASLDTVKGGTSGQFRNEDAGADADLLAGDVETGNMVFMNVPVLIGSYETVARKIDSIAKDRNIEGMLFCWPDWVAGIRTFGERVLPLIDCRKNWDGQTMGDLRTLRADY